MESIGVAERDVRFYVFHHIEVLGFQQAMPRLKRRLAYTRNEIISMYDFEKEKLMKRKFQKIAQQNGISKATYDFRLNNGWHYEDAASLPVLPRGKRYRKTVQWA